MGKLSKIVQKFTNMRDLAKWQIYVKSILHELAKIIIFGNCRDLTFVQMIGVDRIQISVQIQGKLSYLWEISVYLILVEF